MKNILIEIRHLNGTIIAPAMSVGLSVSKVTETTFKYHALVFDDKESCKYYELEQKMHWLLRKKLLDAGLLV